MSLTDQRNQIVETLRGHMKQCPDYKATQNASVGLSHRVLEMLGVPQTSITNPNPDSVPSVPSSAPPQCSSPSASPGVSVKEERSHPPDAFSVPEVPVYPPSVFETFQSSEAMTAFSTHETHDQATLPLLVGPNVRLEEVSPLTNVKLEEVSPLASPSIFALTSAPTSPRAIMPEQPMHLASQHPVHLPLAANLALTARQNSSLSLNWTESTPFLSAGSSPHLSIDTMSQASESSSTQVSAQSSPMLASSQEEKASPPIVYKHKLMKHRKDPQDFTKPSPPASSGLHSRSGRLVLERSFSFPSSSSETWTHDSSMLSPGFHRSQRFNIEERRIPQAQQSVLDESPRGLFPMEGPLDLSNSNSECRQSALTMSHGNFGKDIVGTLPRIERSCSVDGHCQSMSVNVANFMNCNDQTMTASQGEAHMSLPSESNTNSVVENT